VSTAAIERLQALLRIPTVSRPDTADEDQDAFALFRATLAELYPLVHSRLDLELIDGSLLYRWPGEGTGRPAVLMAHHDVVPADEPGWQHDPFAGDVAEDRIWGRGSLDDKGTLVAILEAVEARLAAGFTPAADIYVFSGANEETTGAGSAAAVQLLTSRGVRPGLVLDEGGAVTDDAFPGVVGDIAFVGVSEKGIAGMRLVVQKPGGHAATPARDGATTTLARAILRLESRPSRAVLTAPVAGLLRALAPRASGLQRRMFARPERYRRVLVRVLASRGGEAEALVRTTRAVTRLTGSAADNVIAERATATVNVRIGVGSSVEEAARDIRTAIGDDDVTVEVLSGSDPSPISLSDGPEWERLAGVISEIFPSTIVAPFVMLQASDSRNFARISDTVYRFLPFDLRASERASIHAIDESIRVTTWTRAIAFFDLLIGRL
jgi:carboxypeptidase PM20D1